MIVNLSLFDNEKIKWSFEFILDEIQWVLLSLYQANEVNPPIILPCSFYIIVSVWGILSHFSCHLDTKNSFSEALYNKSALTTLWSVKKANSLFWSSIVLIILDFKKIYSSFSFTDWRSFVKLQLNFFISTSKSYLIFFICLLISSKPSFTFVCPFNPKWSFQTNYPLISASFVPFLTTSMNFLSSFVNPR